MGPCFWIIIFIMYVFSRVLNEDSSCGHNFLDGIASPSPSTYPCQSVGESVIDSFRLEIAIASLNLFQKSFKLSNSNTQTQIILYHILTISFLHPPTGVRLFLLCKQLSTLRNTFAKNLPEKDLCFFRTRLAGRSLPSFHPQIGNLAITGSAIKVHILGIT